VTTEILPVDLAGLRVAITAAGSGIGRVIAAAFLERGARVYVCDRDGAALGETLQAFPGLGGRVVDVARDEQVAAMFEDVAAAFGGLDVLVNNVGIAGPTSAIENVATDELRATLEVNVMAQFFCCGHAVPMLKAGGGGSILNIGSVASRLGFPLRTPYAASKWGVVGLTKSLAIELGGANIRVNAILPGHVESERFHHVVAAKASALGREEAAMRAEFLDAVALKRTVDAQDIANMALFLASPFGENITGQAISVCGNVETMR